MSPPPGFSIKEEQGKVCILKKSHIYMFSSPKAERFSGALVEIGFQRSSPDHSVFVKRRKEGTTSFWWFTFMILFLLTMIRRRLKSLKVICARSLKISFTPWD